MRLDAALRPGTFAIDVAEAEQPVGCKRPLESTHEILAVRWPSRWADLGAGSPSGRAA